LLRLPQLVTPDFQFAAIRQEEKPAQPYKKINSASEHRLILRRVGIETINLYSAFTINTASVLAAVSGLPPVMSCR
jgi:hypothetical protein